MNTITVTNTITGEVTIEECYTTEEMVAMLEAELGVGICTEQHMRNQDADLLARDINRSTSKYEVRYMCDKLGQLLGTDLDYEEAQQCVRINEHGMHPEQAADLVIKKVPTESEWVVEIYEDEVLKDTVPVEVDIDLFATWTQQERDDHLYFIVLGYVEYAQESDPELYDTWTASLVLGNKEVAWYTSEQ